MAKPIVTPKDFSALDALTRDVKPKPKAGPPAPGKKDVGPFAPLPAQPPVHALQPYGTQLGIDEVNTKVQQITEAHQKAFGHKPAPGVVFDILKGEQRTGPIDYTSLFDIPKSKREARVMKVARGDLIASLPVTEPKDEGIRTTYPGTSGMGAFVKEVAAHNPEILHQDTKEGFANPATHISEATLYEPLAGFLFRAGGQIIRTTADMPFGFIAIAKALGTDAWTNDWSFQRSRKLGGMMARGIAEDFKHPYENAGYLMFDMYGAYTGVAGTGARISAATKAAKAGEGARGVGFALAHRPQAGTYEIGFNAYTENVPLMENAGARAIQRYVLGQRQKTLIARQKEGFETRNSMLQVYDEFFSPERSLRKATMDRVSIEFALDMAPVVEMNRMLRWDARAKRFIEGVRQDKSNLFHPKRFRVEDREATEKALQILFTDDVDPVKTWRSFHERTISQLNDDKDKLLLQTMVDLEEESGRDRAVKWVDYQIASHKGQLQALDLAEKLIANPPKRLKPLLDRAIQVSNEQERLKTLFLGFDQEIAEQRIARVGSILRGEEMIDLGGGRVGLTDTPVGNLPELTAKREKRLLSAEQKLRKAKATARLHPGREDFAEEVTKAQALVDRHGKQLGLLQQQLEDIKAAATPLERTVREGGVVSLDFLNRHIQELAAKVGAKVQISPPISKEFKNHGSDFLYNRMTGTAHFPKIEDTHDYMGALHEIGHHEFDRNVPVLTDESKRWLTDEHSPELREAEIHLEEEAWVWNWAVKNSKEPLRSKIYAGASRSLNSYLAHAGYDGRLIVRKGPAFEAFQKLGETTGPADNLKDLRRGTTGSAYHPFERLVYADKKPKGMSSLPRSSRYGIAPPAKMSSLTHRMTGSAIEYGDFRYDVSNLLMGEMVSTLKAVYTVHAHKNLWDSVDGIDHPISPRHKPIRDINSVPNKLKGIVAAMERSEIDPKAAEILTDKNLQALRDYLYPRMEDLEAGEHVRFVDDMFTKTKWAGVDTSVWQAIDRINSGAFGPINEVGRLTMIFLTPAYILNAGGAFVTSAAHQGFLAIPNFGRAVGSHWAYGSEATRLFDALAGSTYARSIVTERTWATKGSQALMEAWQQITDKMFRRSAVIYELRRKGLLKDSMSPDEVVEMLKKEENRPDLVEVAQRSRRNMLDFEKLNWFERSVARHLFFVYAFVHASAVWSVRFLMEHPIKAGAMVQAGRDRQEQIEDFLGGPAPKWFLRRGYFPVGKGTVFDPIQFNMPGILGQYAYPIESVFHTTPYSSPAEFLGPSAKGIQYLITGKDTQDKTLPGSGRLEQSFLGLLLDTPFGAAVTRSKKQEKQQPLPGQPVKTGDLTPIGGAMSRERAGLNQTSFEHDGFWNNWGLLIGRSAIPRDVNKVAVTARAWRDMKETDPEKYTRHQLEMVNQLVTRQGKLLGQTPPREVRDAVKLVAAVSLAIDKARNDDDIPPSPNDKQLGMVEIEVLLKAEKIDEDEASRLRKYISDANGPREAKQRRISLIWNHGGKAWKDWNDRVSDVDWYAGAGYNEAMADMHDAGLGNYTSTTLAPKEARWAYGRKVEAFREKQSEMRDEAETVTGRARTAAQAALKAYEDANDVPVNVNGKIFPSPLVTSFARKTPKQRAQKILSITTAKWQGLSNFDKKLLGKPVDPKTSKVWAQFLSDMSEGADSLPSGHKQISYADRQGRAKQLDAFYKMNGKFYKDWQFAAAPLGVRMAELNPVKNSPNKEEWDSVLGTIKGFWSTYTKNPDGYSMTVVRDDWKKYVHSKEFQDWLDSHKSFKAEVHLYGADLLSRLLN